jgi:hypothetical protein
VSASIIQSIGTGTFRGSWVLDNGATLESSYADLAERYHADDVYSAGTVLVIGGVNEVTVSAKRADTTFAGVVSEKYSHLLNSTAGSKETHPAVALAGRIPCQVVGPISKGDLLVTSDVHGRAETWKPGDSPNAVIGKALSSTNNALDTIEIKV